MTQEYKELLIKDLSCRIPYGVIVNINGISNVKLTSVSWYGEVGVDDGSTYLYPISEVRPYLFPLSSMTEEEKEDLLNYVVGKDSKYFEVCDDVSITDKSPDVQDFKSFDKKWINFNPNTTSRYIEWFLKNHFDFCDLIQKGLALTAPDGMYKI